MRQRMSPRGWRRPSACPHVACRDRTVQLRAAEAPPRPSNGGFGTGVVVGFIFGLVALLLVHWLSPDAELKRGAGCGYLGRIVVGALVMFTTLAAG